ATDAARASIWGAAAAALGWLLLGLWPAPPLAPPAGGAQAVFDRDGGLLRLTLSSDEKYRIWLPLGEIAPSLVQATLLQEDRRFYQHPGVDPFALARAAWHSYVLRDRRIGGSTLSMQVARMRFGIDSRTLGGKLRQIARALELERHYGKDELLEAYLNLAPYGGNVEGAGAASLIYFHHPASQLSPGESLSLAVIPQNPVGRSPESPAGRAALADARRVLFESWRRRALPGAGRGVAQLEVAFSPRATLPFRAPHLVERVLSERPFDARVATTLDPVLQSLVERHVALFCERNRGLGLRNAVVLVAHARSREIRAYLGSADHGDAAIQGQVDGVRARRSPGSALKPLLYGLALDQGLIHPETMLKDASFTVSAYNPENSDGEFLGPLSATQALVRSRNLPAVQLASRLEPPGLYGLLVAAGVGGLREPGFYGLALTLGGVELRMDELVALYAALANGGVFQPLRATPAAAQPAAGVRLLGPEASYLVVDMLRANPRPDLDLAGSAALPREPAPWKTGTSYGFRDAWALGWVGPYVLGVWVGNFDGTPNPAFVGRDAAGPLFFAIADGLRAASADPPPASVPPPALRRVEVCALSGALPGPFCPRRVSTWFIPGKSPIATCSIHREVSIDPRTGLRSCGGEGGRREVYEFWPSDLLKLFRTAGIARRTPPPFAPECARAEVAGLAPRISSPQATLRYDVPAEGGAELPLSAVADADSRRLFWFVDDALVGVARAGETLFWRARPGDHLLRVVDDQGRADERELRVAVLPGSR
ncbi:MAG TPA: penicillin-binding protein 1C, partial [Myxococcota bacterium]|nr:penicillin-binding protein 1C [Myxococcota bacterium]